MSIKLETYQIPKFYSLLEEYGVKSLAPRSNFEVFFGELDDSHISIQINGQICHDQSKRLEEIVDLAFSELSGEEELDSQIDELTAYMILAKPVKPKVKTYEVNHLNIWLNRQQYEFTIELLREDLNVKEIQVTEKFELYRFEKEKQQISFHENGKVIAEKGYSTFAGYLSKAIEEYLPFKEFDMIIGQDEVGNGERIGPLVIGTVGGTPSQIADLQLIGVKDSKMVPRGITIPMAQWIKDSSKLSISRKIDPIDFNTIKKEENKSIADVLASLHKESIHEVIKRLKENGNESDKIVYIIDQFDKYQHFEELEDEKKLDIEVKYSPHAEQESIAVAAASLFAKSTKLRWMMLHEKVHDIGLKRKNLRFLKQHRRADYLLKNI